MKSNRVFSPHCTFWNSHVMALSQLVHSWPSLHVKFEYDDDVWNWHISTFTHIKIWEKNDTERTPFWRTLPMTMMWLWWLWHPLCVVLARNFVLGIFLACSSWSRALVGQFAGGELMRAGTGIDHLKAIIHNGRQVSMYSSAIESVIDVIINTWVVTRCRIVQLLLVSSKKVIETTIPN